MPVDIQQEYESLKAETRPPIWQFSGFLIIAVLIGVSVFSQRKEKGREIELLTHPQAGDILKIKSETGSYSTLKITEVKDDSVIYVLNNYESSTSTGIKNIVADTCYSEESYIVAIDRLKKMYRKKTIYGINRK